MDGANSGELECFIIPAASVAAFLAGQSFQGYTQYQQSGGPCPGLFELKLDPGQYYLALRNTNGSTPSALTYTIEQWRVQ